MFFKIFLFSVFLSNISFGLIRSIEPDKSILTLTDSLNINSKYIITGFDGSHIEGILTSQDSVKIDVKDKNGKILNVLRNQINKIQDKNGNIVYQAVEIIVEEGITSNDGILRGIDSTDECTIILNSGNSLKDVRIIGSNDSAFTITKSHFNKTFKISGINSIEFAKHNFWKGFLYGSLVTIATTLTLSAILAKSVHGEGELGLAILFYGGLLISVPVGIITGAISEFFSNDISYKFKTINSSVKSKRLKYIRGKHKY